MSRDNTRMTVSQFSCDYLFSLAGTRETMRECINWCFDNCSSEFLITEIAGYGGCDYATFDLRMDNDRDAVLFKTFWNDR